MRLVRGGSGDAEELAPLIRAAIRSGAARHYSAEQRQVWSDGFEAGALKRRLARSEVWLAREQGRTVGVGTRRGAWLDLLFVHPEATSRGYGRQLRDRLIRQARAAGVSRMQVIASDSARPLFLDTGWRRIRRVRAMRNGVLLEATLFARHLRARHQI